MGCADSASSRFASRVRHLLAPTGCGITAALAISCFRVTIREVIRPACAEQRVRSAIRRSRADLRQTLITGQGDSRIIS
jgi:hypothetical protein